MTEIYTRVKLLNIGYIYTTTPENLIDGEGEGSIKTIDNNVSVGKSSAAIGHDNKSLMKHCVTLGAGNEAGKTEQEFKDWIRTTLLDRSFGFDMIKNIIGTGDDTTFVYYTTHTESRTFCMTRHPGFAVSDDCQYFVLFGNSDKRYDWENYSGQAIAAGDSCKAKDRGTFAGGRHSEALEDSSFAHGYTCKAKAPQSSAMNYMTETTNWGESAFGKFNKSEPDTLWSVGFGTSESDRKNAIEAKQDGSGRIAKQGETADSIVRKDYVDPVKEQVSNIEEQVSNVEEQVSSIEDAMIKNFSLQSLSTGAKYFGGYAVIPLDNNVGEEVTLSLRVRLPKYQDEYVSCKLKSVDTLWGDYSPNTTRLILTNDNSGTEDYQDVTFTGKVIQFTQFRWYGTAPVTDISSYGKGILLCLTNCSLNVEPITKPQFVHQKQDVISSLNKLPIDYITKYGTQNLFIWNYTGNIDDLRPPNIDANSFGIYRCVLSTGTKPSFINGFDSYMLTIQRDYTGIDQEDYIIQSILFENFYAYRVYDYKAAQPSWSNWVEIVLSNSGGSGGIEAIYSHEILITSYSEPWKLLTIKIINGSSTPLTLDDIDFSTVRSKVTECYSVDYMTGKFHRVLNMYLEYGTRLDLSAISEDSINYTITIGQVSDLMGTDTVTEL